MLLIPVRHGETEWNRAGREMGHLDSPLTETGARQSLYLARRLMRRGFDVLYTSDLGRAIQTAEIIGSVCAVEPQIEPGLRERNMGAFEGLLRSEIRERFGTEHLEYERRGFFAVVPGGETVTERTQRSVRVLTAIAERHSNETVVAVTHGGFLMGFLGHVMGLAPGNGWRFRKRNASFNAFEHSGGRWRLETWNDSSHLAALEALDDPSVEQLPLAEPSPGGA
jgi:broad specificity phosphatase PhoE